MRKPCFSFYREKYSFKKENIVKRNKLVEKPDEDFEPVKKKQTVRRENIFSLAKKDIPKYQLKVNQANTASVGNYNMILIQ